MNKEPGIKEIVNEPRPDCAPVRSGHPGGFRAGNNTKFSSKSECQLADR